MYYFLQATSQAWATDVMQYSRLLLHVFTVIKRTKRVFLTTTQTSGAGGSMLSYNSTTIRSYFLQLSVHTFLPELPRITGFHAHTYMHVGVYKRILFRVDSAWQRTAHISCPAVAYGSLIKGFCPMQAQSQMPALQSLGSKELFFSFMWRIGSCVSIKGC